MIGRILSHLEARIDFDRRFLAVREAELVMTRERHQAELEYTKVATAVASSELDAKEKLLNADAMLRELSARVLLLERRSADTSNEPTKETNG